MIHATLKSIKQTPRSSNSGTAESESSFDLDQVILSTYRLMSLKTVPDNVKEASMYLLIKEFIMLVARHVRGKANSHNDAVAHRANGSGTRTRAMSKTTTLGTLNPHVILPYKKADYKPEGGDDSRKVDVALGLFNLSNTIKQQKYPKYKDMFAIIEAKR
ncbi:hypothetical protein IWW48_006138 [Coemansia sp. RSA 1200]|nr:hypothetical protein IWW48_006138 [Coemansia sp. RSA 1200]